jgi:hypothetical protein
MNQPDFAGAARRGWWDRLVDSLRGRTNDLELELPADSLFAARGAVPATVADVPESVKGQIRDAALLDLFNQLESSLRLLLYATTPGREPPSAERCQQILSVWRYELEHRINLMPDTYCGAVQRYEPEMAAAYTIYGRCEPGDLLRINVPCWRMHEQIVVRGEAEVLSEDEGGGATGEALDRMPIAAGGHEDPVAG